MPIMQSLYYNDKELNENSVPMESLGIMPGSEFQLKFLEENTSILEILEGKRK